MADYALPLQLVSLQRRSAASLVDGHVGTGVLITPTAVVLVPPAPDGITAQHGEYHVVIGPPGLEDGYVVSATPSVVHLTPEGYVVVVFHEGKVERQSSLGDAVTEGSFRQWFDDVLTTATAPEPDWLAAADELLRLGNGCPPHTLRALFGPGHWPAWHQWCTALWYLDVCQGSGVHPWMKSPPAGTR
jgi:hypothetical protein